MSQKIELYTYFSMNKQCVKVIQNGNKAYLRSVVDIVIVQRTDAKRGRNRVSGTVTSPLTDM